MPRPLHEKILVSTSRSFADRLRISLRGQAGRWKEGRGDPLEDSFRRLDGRVSVELPRGSLYLNVTNLTDEDYPDLTGGAVVGRGMMVGYRIDGEG